MSHLHRDSSFTSCFFSATNSGHHPSDAPPPSSISGKPNLSTCVYSTSLGLFSLTWSRSTFFGHSLHIDLQPVFDNSNKTSNVLASSPISYCSNYSSSSSSPPPFSSHAAPAFSFHLHIKPFMFWKKHGFKKLTSNTSLESIQIFWDLSSAKFGSGPEPISGFFIAVVVDGEMALLVGDSVKEAYAKTKAELQSQQQALVLRREHVFGNRVYTTKAKFINKMRDISIDFSTRNDSKLCFSVDNIRVLQVKRLKWKFRGNERIVVDGVAVQISWDVYNWLFDHRDNGGSNGHAVFMFRFEERDQTPKEDHRPTWQKLQQSGGGTSTSAASFGMSGIEWRKMRKRLMTRRAARSSSSSSSSSSSGRSSSVMEWANMEETDELSPGPDTCSLVVYVWTKNEKRI